MNILVSKCLLGEICRYDGKSCKNEKVVELGDKYTLIGVCPEILGGLSVPREPCEIKDGAVLTKSGKDVTAAFKIGAEKVFEIAKDKDIRFAILKARSPSCGLGKIYDGNFRGKLTDGNGITAEKLYINGVHIMTEEEIKL